MTKKMNIAPKLAEYFRPKNFDRTGFTDEEWRQILDCRQELKAVIRVCEAVDAWAQCVGSNDDMFRAIDKLNDLTGRNEGLR